MYVVVFDEKYLRSAYMEHIKQGILNLIQTFLDTIYVFKMIMKEYADATWYVYTDAKCTGFDITFVNMLKCADLQCFLIVKSMRIGLISISQICTGDLYNLLNGLM